KTEAEVKGSSETDDMLTDREGCQHQEHAICDGDWDRLCTEYYRVQAKKLIQIIVWERIAKDRRHDTIWRGLCWIGAQALDGHAIYFTRHARNAILVPLRLLA